MILKQLPRVSEDLHGWPWTQETPADVYTSSPSWPKISIVTPSYNQGIYIEETIRSVVLQNYPNLEFIVIDGGSSDETVSILKKYDQWITYWISEKDRGQSHAINKGIEKCSGDIFNWLNSDDYLAPGALHAIAQTFMKEQRLVVAAQSRIFSETNEWISTTPVGTDFTMFSKARIDQPATYWDFKTFKTLCPVPENQHLVMDAVLWFKFLLQHDQSAISQLPHVVVNFREHIASKTTNNRAKITIQRAQLLSKVRNALKGKSNEFTPYCKLLSKSRKAEILRGLTDFKRYWAKEFLKSGQFINAMSSLL